MPFIMVFILDFLNQGYRLNEKNEKACFTGF